MFCRAKSVEQGSLTTLREKFVKIGGKAVGHGRYVTFQVAEVAVPREPFRKIWTNGRPNEARSPRSGHRMAAQGMPFPWRWNGGTIFLNLEVIWDNVGIVTSASIFVTGSRLRPDNFQNELDRLEGRLS